MARGWTRADTTKPPLAHHTPPPAIVPLVSDPTMVSASRSAPSLAGGQLRFQLRRVLPPGWTISTTHPTPTPTIGREALAAMMPGRSATQSGLRKNASIRLVSCSWPSIHARIATVLPTRAAASLTIWSGCSYLRCSGIHCLKQWEAATYTRTRASSIGAFHVRR
jgi:hypothetical protein